MLRFKLFDLDKFEDDVFISFDKEFELVVGLGLPICDLRGDYAALALLMLRFMGYSSS